MELTDKNIDILNSLRDMSKLVMYFEEKDNMAFTEQELNNLLFIIHNGKSRLDQNIVGEDLLKISRRNETINKILNE